MLANDIHLILWGNLYINAATRLFFFRLLCMQTIPQLHIYIETQYRELLANYRMYVLVLGLLVWVAQLGPIQAKPSKCTYFCY